MAKFTQVIQKQVVNHETGEVKSEEKLNVFRTENEPEYVKLYLNDIVKLIDLPASSSSVLFWILKRMGYDNQVVLVQGVKKQIASEIGTSANTVIRRIQELKSKGIIIPTNERSIYVVNPDLFARGKWEDIKKIKLSIQYGKDGRFIKAEFDRQLEMFSNEEAEKE